MGMVIVACVRENCRNLSPNLHGANCYSWEQFFLCRPWEALARASEALADYATLVSMDLLDAGSDTLRFLGRFFLSAMAYCKVAGIRRPGFNRRGYCRG
jgi:hypothetical protein